MQDGRTQRGLAYALNIDPSSVSRIKDGTRRLKVSEIEPAARYLGIEPPYAYRTKSNAVVERYIDLPADLRDELFARAIDMQIEPEELLARAVRAAFSILGPRR